MSIKGVSRTAIFNAVDAPYLDLLKSTDTTPTFSQKKQRKLSTTSLRAVKCTTLAHTRCGAGNSRIDEVARRHGWVTFVSMQDEYSLLYREEEREMLTYCKFHGIGVIPWSPFAAGDLARLVGTKLFGLTLPEARNSKGSSQRDLPKGDEPHRGCRRVEENIVTGIVLTPEEVAYLEAPYVPRPVRGHD